MTARPPDPDLLAARLEPEPGIAAETIELDDDTAALVDLGRELRAVARFAPPSGREADARRAVLRRVAHERRRRLLGPLGALVAVGALAVALVALTQPGWGAAVGAIVDGVRRELGIDDARPSESPNVSDEPRPSPEPTFASPAASTSAAPASSSAPSASPSPSAPRTSPAPSGGSGGTVSPSPSPTPSPSAASSGDPAPPVPVPTPPPRPSPPVPSEVPPPSDG